MNKRWSVALGTAVALAAAPAAAQPAAFRDQLVDQLAGKWVLRGTMDGREVVHDVNAQWVLGHQYMLLQRTSRERKPGTGTPAYQAHIYIGWDQGRYGAVWLDVFGEVATPVLGTAQPMINALPFVFTARDGSATRTTMTFDRRTRRWHWQTVSEKNGQATTTADLQMLRAPDTGASGAGQEGGTAPPAEGNGLKAPSKPSGRN